MVDTSYNIAGWQRATLEVEGREYTANIKRCERPSPEFGVDGGRIIKLDLWEDGRLVAVYDRGWDRLPETLRAERAVHMLLHDYN